MSAKKRRKGHGLAENLLLRTGRSLLLDTSALIYFLGRVEPYFPVVERLFRRVQQGEAEVLVSSLTEAELLVRPKILQDREAEEHIEGFLSEDGISVIDVDRHIARLAAEIRANSATRLPDAIIIATALARNCEVIVGNDRQWLRLKGIPFVLLDEVVDSSLQPT